jgi:iron-sulfur cluster protein
MATRKQKAARIRELLDTEGAAVAENTKGFNAGRYETTATLDGYEELKQEARAIKEQSIENIEANIDALREQVEANGGTVYLAEDEADANRYITEVVADEDADTVVKSKSMTSEEIEVNEALEADGIDVWETDLAEFILQVADEAPSHIVAPAIHRSRDSIAELFNEVFDPEEPLETAEELTAFAREVLGERYTRADVAMTGANFLVAESGTMALVTSEGNARKCVSTADTHIAVAGVEKIIPTYSDLQPFIELIGRSGTGQDITSYVSLFTPPVDAPTLDFENPDAPLGDPDERDFHLVLLDNGRMDMREDDELRETLYCIRCSACLNSCANFQQVGGHAFGGETYSGGIATGWEAGVHGLDAAEEFNDFCTGCSRCVNQCPVGIDIPWINTVVRDRLNRGEDADTFDHLVDGLTPDEEAEGLDIQKRLFGSFERLARLGSATAPVSNWLPKLPGARPVMEWAVGVDRERDLPTFKRETLAKWFRARGGSTVAPEDARREVALYPDLYTNFVQVERGKDAVRLLEALDVHVTMPEVAASGRAPLSQGMISTATAKAEKAAATLQPALDADRDIVVVEPTDLHMFLEEYEKLLDADRAERIAANSYDIMEYAYGLVENGADVDALADGEGTSVFYHSHCQQRTMQREVYTEAMLDQCGFDVVTSDVECCGMAGSFGYKTEYYDLSMAVGDDLGEQAAAADADIVAASGTSCLEQLDALAYPPLHPTTVLADD